MFSKHNGRQAPADTEEELLAWVRLVRTDRVGPVTARQLVGRFGSAGVALERLPELARRAGAKEPSRPCSRQEAEAEIARVRRLGGRTTALGAADYPTRLRDLADAPPVLHVIGTIGYATNPAIAIVGARNASQAGCRVAHEMAATLGAQGLCIVSGLARGIDTAAHRGALPTGTVACIAGGLDSFYPPENEALQRAIAGNGLIVTEAPPGTRPTGRLFPRRNRLIAALGLGVVLVEAAARSGSLITARLANELGRDVFVVPGHPLDPRSAGGNRLIRQGATLVETADDVIEDMAAMLARHPVEPKVAAAPASTLPHGAGQAESGVESVAEPGVELHATILRRLTFTPVQVDELVRDCQLSAATVQSVLAELDLAGKIERHPGNRVSRLDG